MQIIGKYSNLYAIPSMQIFYAVFMCLHFNDELKSEKKSITMHEDTSRAIKKNIKISLQEFCLDLLREIFLEI